MRWVNERGRFEGTVTSERLYDASERPRQWIRTLDTLPSSDDVHLTKQPTTLVVSFMCCGAPRKNRSLVAKLLVRWDCVLIVVSPSAAILNLSETLAVFVGALEGLFYRYRGMRDGLSCLFCSQGKLPRQVIAGCRTTPPRVLS